MVQHCEIFIQSFLKVSKTYIFLPFSRGIKMEVIKAIRLLCIFCIITSTNSAKVYHLPRRTTPDNGWLRAMLKETGKKDAFIWTYDLKQLKPDSINEFAKSHSNSTIIEQLDCTTYPKTRNAQLLWKRFLFLRRSTEAIHVIILNQTENFI